MLHDPNMQHLLAVTAALFVIVVAARICGWLATLIRQPAVVGEMVSGVLLGPSVLGALQPSFSGYVFSDKTKPTLYVIAMVGLCFYMFLVGLEHEFHPRSRKEASVPVVLSIAGVLVPLAIGSVVALRFADRFRPPDVRLSVFVLFVAGSLALTAFPMLARVLEERRMQHTQFGAVAIRAAAIDDAAAWCVLAVVSAMSIHGTLFAAWQTVVPAVLFMIAAFFILPKVFRPPFQRAVESGHVNDTLFVTLLGVVLAAGWFTDYIGIFSVFGGFICGMAFPRVAGLAPLVQARLLQTIRCFFLPVFFAFSGLNTDLSNALKPSYLVAFGVLFVAAFASKVLASVSVLRSFRWGWGETAAMGGLMNARGLMILIFINIGLSLGIIGSELFSLLVLIAIVTTALAMPLYRLHFTPRREEEARQGWRTGSRDDPDDSDAVPVPEQVSRP